MDRGRDKRTQRGRGRRKSQERGVKRKEKKRKGQKKRSKKGKKGKKENKESEDWRQDWSREDPTGDQRKQLPSLDTSKECRMMPSSFLALFWNFWNFFRVLVTHCGRRSSAATGLAGTVVQLVVSGRGRSALSAGVLTARRRAVLAWVPPSVGLSALGCPCVRPRARRLDRLFSARASASASVPLCRSGLAIVCLMGYSFCHIKGKGLPEDARQIRAAPSDG